MSQMKKKNNKSGSEESSFNQLKRWIDGEPTIRQERARIIREAEKEVFSEHPEIDEETVKKAVRKTAAERYAENRKRGQQKLEAAIVKRAEREAEELSRKEQFLKLKKLLRSFAKWKNENELPLYKHFYRLVAIAICVSVICLLLFTAVFLPAFGSSDSPVNNEVSYKYIVDGVKDTGAVNVVAGMILDYRAFDTFGESTVLFAAACSVIILLRNDRVKKGKKETDKLYEPMLDGIVRTVSFVLVPLIFIFGIYIMLNGHISPGGGFSGGAVTGAGLILFYNAFGNEKTQKFFTYKTYNRITFVALAFYACAKGYSFFTGANGLETGIPLGTPGAILSSGLILPLNIAVGFIVACTMFGFYSLFSKGEI